MIHSNILSAYWNEYGTSEQIKPYSNPTQTITNKRGLYLFLFRGQSSNAAQCLYSLRGLVAAK